VSAVAARHSLRLDLVPAAAVQRILSAVNGVQRTLDALQRTRHRVGARQPSLAHSVAQQVLRMQVGIVARGGAAESPKPGRSGTNRRRPVPASGSMLRSQWFQLPLPPCSSTRGRDHR